MIFFFYFDLVVFLFLLRPFFSSYIDFSWLLLHVFHFLFCGLMCLMRSITIWSAYHLKISKWNCPRRLLWKCKCLSMAEEEKSASCPIDINTSLWQWDVMTIFRIRSISSISRVEMLDMLFLFLFLFRFQFAGYCCRLRLIFIRFDFHVWIEIILFLRFSNVYI